MTENIFYVLEKIIRQGIPCLFHLITGLYCPGCGGTRAALYLFQGKVLKSAWYHPLVVYMAVIGSLEFITFVISKVRKKPQLYLGHLVTFTNIGVVIVILNMIVKNYMLLFMGIDPLP
ncbi:DUF2752 domain-containing protein [Clostridium sp. MCC353]|uniref:DUF2752 domain-containing protein n=1 Tax=Clostridium sp. MCC353 TaxID=2592646 RepID=UPI001C014593|nr:DUF2752 domain-containing protein [Clostridium sp. MCC353]MBT9776273.1 DUF2752 domain-containing protein [Clostridium sp. MCC353]